MKLCHLTASISRAGGGLYPIIQRLSHDLCKSEQRIDVSVIGLWDEHTAADSPTWHPVKPIAVESWPPQAFGYAPQLSSLLTKGKFDLVHVHGIWMYPSWANLTAAMRCQRPYLISPHGMLDPWAVANSRWKKKLVEMLYERRHLNNAACLHALSPAEVVSFRQFGLKNPVCVIPNGVDLVTETEKKAPVWKQQLPAGKKVLLFLGRIHPKKGLPLLLKAWAELKRSQSAVVSDWVVAIAGWDQNGHQTELQKFISEQNLSSDVLFIGPQFGEEKTATLQAADAFVLPSFSEGLPVAVLEAWAYGLPVAMTKECNIPEGFACNAALELPLGNSELTKALCLFLKMSEQERLSMGKSGLELVKQRFHWKSITADYLAVYRWMLGEGPIPDCVEFA